ncbi:amidoligase family protein [Oceanimonas pelagia]|uniref:Amidoligase family protein n=1 Tax=Oceanimonas pelagia TaxID=3028314 RepID=A0AA50KLS1_9GAMM|nr:amidoligase family protein [Oceanimonas pelagia]WMC09799.1 amidoligase family protein [Oceanimonas pelagia]
MPLTMPPQQHTREGQERRLGVELELSGITLPQLVSLVADTLGGESRPVSEYEFNIPTSLGDFRAELDFDYLKQLARAQRRHPPGELEQAATDLLGSLARQLVPLELVCPPLPLSRLDLLNRLFERLREYGAHGTRHALYYAFGLHLNPELPDTDMETLLRYFRAYLCLHDWLEQHEDIVTARKLSPYIRAFPKDYVRLVLNSGYRPDMAGFTADYLAWNPTRNRAMDLLPLLAWHDEQKVQAVVQDDKVNKRPTLHYRLPNSDIDNPVWSLRHAWAGWLQVERLASDEPRLAGACRAYLNHLEQLTPDFMDPWSLKVRPWLR